MQAEVPPAQGQNQDQDLFVSCWDQEEIYSRCLGIKALVNNLRAYGLLLRGTRARRQTLQLLLERSHTDLEKQRQGENKLRELDSDLVSIAMTVRSNFEELITSYVASDACKRRLVQQFGPVRCAQYLAVSRCDYWLGVAERAMEQIDWEDLGTSALRIAIHEGVEFHKLVGELRDSAEGADLAREFSSFSIPRELDGDPEGDLGAEGTLPTPTSPPKHFSF